MNWVYFSCGVALFLLAVLFVLSLCYVAGRADRVLQELLRRKKDG
jgi:hypothetical protein